MISPTDLVDLAHMIFSEQIRLRPTVKDGLTTWTMVSYTEYSEKMYPVYGIAMGTL